MSSKIDTYLYTSLEFEVGQKLHGSIKNAQTLTFDLSPKFRQATKRFFSLPHVQKGPDDLWIILTVKCWISRVLPNSKFFHTLTTVMIGVIKWHKILSDLIFLLRRSPILRLDIKKYFELWKLKNFRNSIPSLVLISVPGFPND